MSSAEQKHPYHLVDPSPWPFVGSMAAFVLTFAVVLKLHPSMLGAGIENFVNFMGWWIIAPGMLLVLYTMLRWWLDVVHEAEVGKHHTPVVQIGLRYGMALFIASEVMFFAAFFWAFFDNSLFATDPQQFVRYDAIGGIWPPKGTKVFDPWDLPLLNTMILLLSGVTVTWAHHALREGHRKDVLQALGITVFLGLCFTALQAVEYSEAPFSFAMLLTEGKLTEGGTYSSTFYMATGFHGFHVMVGTIFLAVCWLRVRKGQFTPTHHFGFEAAAWYWHFVDVVWLFLFFAVYIWGSAGAPIAVH